MLPSESSEILAPSDFEPSEQPEIQVPPTEVHPEVPTPKVDETQFLNALREQLQEAGNHEVQEKEVTAGTEEVLKEAYQNESGGIGENSIKKDTALWKKSVKGLFTLFKIFIKPF